MKKIMRLVKLLNVISLIIAGIINAIGVNMFLMPVHIYDSRLPGSSIRTKIPLAENKLVEGKKDETVNL